MNSVIKIPSNQGTLSSTQNLVDFEFGDGSSNYDLSSSYVSLDISLASSVVQSAGAIAQTSGNTAYDFALNVADKNKTGGANTNNLFSNIVLVKNAHLRSQSNGMMEDIRRVDILRTNLKNYQKNNISKDSHLSVSGLNAGQDEYGNDNGFFLEKNQLGEDLSTSKTFEELRIPLKDIFNLGVLPSYSSANYGRSKIHLELNLGDVTANQIDFNNTVGKKTMADSTLSSAGNNLKQYGDVANPLVWGNTANQDPVCPYYVGQMIEIDTAVQSPASGQPNAPPVIAGQIRQITKITRQADGTYAILIKNPFNYNAGGGFVAGQKYTGVTIKQNALATTSYGLSYSNPQLVLQQTSNPAPPKGSIDYTSYTTEEDNGNDRASFSKNYTMEANAFNLYIMFAQKFNSADNGLSSYRLRVDGVDVSNRDISVSSGLHYDALQMGLRNGDMMVGNLLEVRSKDGESNANKLKQANASECKMIVAPLPSTSSPKLVQLNCSQTALKDFQLYKEVSRVI